MSTTKTEFEKPQQITEPDLQLITRLRNDAFVAQQTLEKVLTLIAERYGIVAGDQLNQDGTITRVNTPPAE